MSINLAHLYVVILGFRLERLVGLERGVHDANDHSNKLCGPPSDHICEAAHVRMSQLARACQARRAQLRQAQFKVSLLRFQCQTSEMKAERLQTPGLLTLVLKSHCAVGTPLKTAL